MYTYYIYLYMYVFIYIHIRGKTKDECKGEEYIIKYRNKRGKKLDGVEENEERGWCTLVYMNL